MTIIVRRVRVPKRRPSFLCSRLSFVGFVSVVLLVFARTGRFGMRLRVVRTRTLPSVVPGSRRLSRLTIGRIIGCWSRVVPVLIRVSTLIRRTFMTIRFGMSVRVYITFRVFRVESLGMRKRRGRLPSRRRLTAFVVPSVRFARRMPIPRVILRTWVRGLNTIVKT